MKPVISAAQMRQIDLETTQKYHIPSLILMESAAEACLREIAKEFEGDLAGKKVRILCGPGNNGGDGAALARALINIGVKTDVVLIGSVETTKGDARINFDALKNLASFIAGTDHQPLLLSFIECKSVGEWEEIARPRSRYDVIVDALFGTGLTRPLDGVHLQVVEHLAVIKEARDRSSSTKPLIVSIDLPSGLNADLSQPIGKSVEADLTVTFTSPKPANVLPPACNSCGRLVVASIGSPSSLIEAAHSPLLLTEAADVREWLKETRYTPESYKNSHGHLLLVAGSRGYTGAAVLSGNAAMTSGAGLVTIATSSSAISAIAAQAMPEVMTAALEETDRGAVSENAIDYFQMLAAKATAIAAGPGLSSEDERTRTFVRKLVERRKVPMVLDADALNCLAPWPRELNAASKTPLILTPHPGEMLRLMGTTERSALSDRVSAARDFAIKNSVILVLKGSRSIVAAPDGRVFINPTGNAGLGTAGAGDTLTGIIGGFLAQSFATLGDDADAVAATVAALYIGGLAGDIAAGKLGMRTMVASDIRTNISAAILALDARGELPGRLDCSHHE